jgi:hypothetical protein
MKKLLLLLSACFAAAVPALPNSTINNTNAYSYGANIGWMNWRPSAATGVVIGEYVCSGWIYAANVGWINMGSGFPANQIQYSNASGTDFGVNYMIEATSPGMAKLRGLAYGANIGWINFEPTGNPRLRFSDGRMEGYAWSANCGWINLGDGTFAVQTDSVTPGHDSDADGMADAFEFIHFAGLGANPNADSDGDGMTDLEEYLNGTNPLQSTDRLRVTQFSTNAGGTSSLITWTTTPSRLYRIEFKNDMIAVDWTADPAFSIITPDAGSLTQRPITAASSARRFYRVRAIRPLMP